jgi:hypothetical protein
MRLPNFRSSEVVQLSLVVLSFAGVVAAFAPAWWPLEQANVVTARQGQFEESFAPGSEDTDGRFMGGTEMRVLAAHAGKLYAGNGYWEDRPGPEGPQGAQILVLDRPGGQWRVDHDFEERMLNGWPRNLAVSALREVTFTTNGAGERLPEPVPLLLATTWDLALESAVFSRDDATGAWTSATIAPDRQAPGDRHLQQVRSLGFHRDRVTGVDYVFAGQDPLGVFTGTYDAAVPGRVRWSATPEFDISTIAQDAFPGLTGRARISSFAECNDRLYAAVGQQIYERIDGVQAHWRLLYTNSFLKYSETGLRGLTAVPNPAGGGQTLIVAVEGDASRIVRIDPRDGKEAVDLDLQSFLGKAWGMRVSYAIAAYNDMAVVRDPKGSSVVLFGIEAFIPPMETISAGHTVVEVGRGRLESAAWYLVRRANGQYSLHRIADRPIQPMVATRAILASPFPQDGDALYFAGYDANKSPAHNTAWIMRSTVAEAIGGP